MHAAFSFFATRRFLPLFGTQFLGAFNDNLLKTAIVVLVSFRGLHLAGLSPALLVNLAAGIFILPFFLFSASAGKVAERFDKARLARLIKQVEIGIMLIAGAGFYLNSAGLLFSALFLMGVHSTFFGPIKYSVLPQYLGEHELVGGNGLIEMGTFLAILIGQIGGSLMVQSGPALSMLMLLLCAIAGYASSRHMPAVAPTAPGLRLSANIWRDSTELLGRAWRMPDVRSAIMGISWFWLMGAVYTTQLPTFTHDHLGGNADVYTLLLALFSIGIGLGSMLCAKLSDGELQLGLVLLGGAGMTLAGLDLGLSRLEAWHGALQTVPQFLHGFAAWRALVDVGLLGFFGGFFTVPLYTWLQTASPAEFRSQAIAANNIVNGCYMVLSALAAALLLLVFHTIALLFVIASIANVVALGHLAWRAPRLWRDRFAWIARR
ncbi:MFS transporter [Paludibacterium yongneupense]|uniref:MFS transporter n=1 Tax=Paludibacterium yongneupense TaxID=400061 RepID=UPI0003FADFA3|nr:MFS transporter [Paludibacterium yongneupense]